LPSNVKTNPFRRIDKLLQVDFRSLTKRCNNGCIRLSNFKQISLHVFRY